MFGLNSDFYLFLYCMCVLSFGLFAYDKHRACYGKWRIPEAVLMICTVLMGAFGSLCAMVIFNHKTQKSLFNIGVPVLLLLQILGMAFFFTR